MTIAVFVLSLIAVMAIGVPIAFALILCGVALMLHLDMFDAQIVAQTMVNGADNYVLMAVPFFLLAGELMTAGGLSKRIIDLALALVGSRRGGLGYVAIIASLLMASLSGSAIADTAALAAILLPMMRDAGYPQARSAGLIAAGGIIAPIIPPSIGFVIFGVAAGLSITKLFLAGVVPGLLLGLGLVVAWFLVSLDAKIVAKRDADRKSLGTVVVRAAWALALPVIIIGGMKIGVFTPTEAAVVAAVYSAVVGFFIYRELTLKALIECCIASAKLSASLMFLIGAAFVSAWLVTVAEIPGEIVALLSPLIEHPTLLLLAMMALVFIVGMPLDFTPTILILTPILMPLCAKAGIDPIYFGVLFIINNAIGLITPPVGTVLNTVASVGRLRIEAVTVGVWPFLLAQLLVLVLLVLFPVLVLGPSKWFS